MFLFHSSFEYVLISLLTVHFMCCGLCLYLCIFLFHSFSKFVFVQVFEEESIVSRSL